MITVRLILGALGYILIACLVFSYLMDTPQPVDFADAFWLGCMWPLTIPFLTLFMVFALIVMFVKRVVEKLFRKMRFAEKNEMSRKRKEHAGMG